MIYFYFVFQGCRITVKFLKQSSKFPLDYLILLIYCKHTYYRWQIKRPWNYTKSSYHVVLTKIYLKCFTARLNLCELKIICSSKHKMMKFFSSHLLQWSIQCYIKRLIYGCQTWIKKLYNQLLFFWEICINTWIWQFPVNWIFPIHYCTYTILKP